MGTRQSKIGRTDLSSKSHSSGQSAAISNGTETILVRGIEDIKTQDLQLFFGSHWRSGGGEIKSLNIFEEPRVCRVAQVSFKQPHVATRMLNNGPLKLQGRILKIQPFIPTEPTPRSAAAEKVTHHPASLSSGDKAGAETSPPAVAGPKLYLSPPNTNRLISRLPSDSESEEDQYESPVVPEKSHVTIHSVRPTSRSAATENVTRCPTSLSTGDIGMQMKTPVPTQDVQRTYVATPCLHTSQASRPLIQDSIDKPVSRSSKQSSVDIALSEPLSVENNSVKLQDIHQMFQKDIDDIFSGVVVTTNAQKQFGFIRSDHQLPHGFTQKNVYFNYRNVLGKLSKGEEVSFTLDAGNRAKPQVRKVWNLLENEPKDYKPEESHGRLQLSEFVDFDMDQSMSRSRQVKAGQDKGSRSRSHSLGRKKLLQSLGTTKELRSLSLDRFIEGETLEIIDTRPSRNKLEYVGRIKFTKENFGFIKPYEPLPADYIQGKDVYFTLDKVRAGQLDLTSGDEVAFSLGTKNKQKPMAFNVTLVSCKSRRSDQLDKYISKIHSMICKQGPGARKIQTEHLVSILACTTIWQYIGRHASFSRESLISLIEIMLELDKNVAAIPEMFTKIMEIIASSALLDPQNGELKKFLIVIHACVPQTMMVMQNFLLMLIRRVPSKIRAVISLVKPMVNSSKESTEYFLYNALKTSARFSHCEIDDMEWNELPLVPTASELLRGPLEDNINLRPVKCMGPYDSPEEYMDTYFRLFRADCFDGLKRGIQEFLQGKLDSRDMNVFYDISLVGIRVTQQGQGLNLGLRLTPVKPVKNWETCSHLMFGNLLCLSPSGTFTDTIWATVISRDLLNKFSTVVVELCSETNSISDPEAVMALQKAEGQTIAVESPTYYRAYQPIMKALQRMEPDDIPFQEELINVQKPQIPDFVEAETVVDATVLYTGCHEDINVMDLCKRNSPIGTTSLDQSQETAVKTALMQRLAIIQGPPGTGKTFVGIKLIQLLLSMSSKPPGPILVLTYKNHALDEFLKDLIKHDITDLVRVGGRSQDPELTSYNLNELKKNNKIQSELFKEITSFRSEIQNLKPDVEDAFNDLEKSKDFDMECFIHAVSDEQLLNFLEQCRWNETTAQSFKTDVSGSGWNEVKKKGKRRNPIQLQEVKELIESSPCSLKELLCDEEAGDLQTKIMFLVESALKLWLPSKKSVQEFEDNLESRFTVTKPNFPSVTESRENDKAVNTDDDEDDEEDLEDLQQERLAADFSSKALNVHTLLKDFRFLDKSAASTSMCSLHGNAHKLAQEDPITSLLNRIDLWSFNSVERLKVVQVMLLKQFEEKSEEFQRLLTKYQSLCAVKNELEIQNNANILNSKDVIGLTITGASLNHHLLSQVQAPIILVEEAAEVLEPQILAILGTWVKQIILIGDHKQLKPGVDSYVLRRDFSFDTSMMERLLNNEFPYCRLRMQNRMMPEFAELLLDIYPDLQSNTQRVGKHKKALCIDQAMYFWDNVCYETRDRSFTNEEEAERAVRLALFLIQQGDMPVNITILAAYQGQVVLLRKKMKAAKIAYKKIFPVEVKESADRSTSRDGTENSEPMENKIKIHTIDMYQGDENEFVIISLVRSNPEGKIGFLSQLNRRCVAQSRSRRGLYFIGNRETLSQNKHWSTMISKMDQNASVGYRLPLCCPRHPDCSKLKPSSAAEITLACFCSKACSIEMACGKHICKKTCQPTHGHTLCQEAVDYVFPKCRHVHKFKCFMVQHPQDLVCKDNVQFEFDKCGHLGYKECHQKVTEMKCKELCPRKLPCEHPCPLKCGDPCSPDKCEQCRKIKEQEAEQIRKREQMLREKALVEVRREIQNLAMNQNRGKVMRQVLDCNGPYASEYYDVEDKVLKFIQPGHKWFPCVTKIEKVFNIDLQERWLNAKLKMKDPSRSALKFHGTSTEATEGIIKEGFHMPKPSNQMYGAGIYFASDSSKSAQGIYTKGSNTILLCDVLLGKSFTVSSAQRYMSLTELKKRGCDSLFAKRGTRDTGGVLYDEFVVYDPAQALPVYIIHYTKSGVDSVPNIHSLQLQAMSQSSIKCHNIKAKRTVNMDDSLDVHFRIAESQVLRLSQKTGKQMEITSVDYYINPPLVRMFEDKSKDLQTKYGNTEDSQSILAFHGTKQENIKSIVNNNFSLSKIARGVYGAGIYFSEFPDVSMGYGKALLLCKVLPGKSYDCLTTMNGASLKHGYDSHRVGADPDGRGAMIVIFDPDQILPSYVINLK